MTKSLHLQALSQRRGRETKPGNADGTGVAAVYFTDAEAIAAWARDPVHRAAKKRGREEWYRHYLIRICKVEREYGRPDA